MSLAFKVRDLMIPRTRVLREAAIPSGAKVLDYGCGPGSYARPLAGIVGPKGHIYALDANPLAIKATERLVRRNQIQNLTTILSDCDTGLPDASVDVALLYDILHHLPQPEKVLRELHRVLKPGGLLSCSDHHLKDADIVKAVTGSGWFSLRARGQKTHSFRPAARS